MNSTLRVILTATLIFGLFGFSSSNPLTGQGDVQEMTVDENNNEIPWTWLGLGTMTKGNFIMVCVIISVSIFVIVLVFAIFIFIIEAQEFKALSRKTANECRSHCYGIEMERRLNPKESRKLIKCHLSPQQHCGIVALDAMDSSNSSRCTDKLLPYSPRFSLDEISFKTIPEEDERQLEDFHSIY